MAFIVAEIRKWAPSIWRRAKAPLTTTLKASPDVISTAMRLQDPDATQDETDR